jgi:hypothetical protein
LFGPKSMDVEAVLHLRIFFVLRVEISSFIWGYIVLVSWSKLIS